MGGAMLKKFFIAMGVIFACLIGSCAIFVGVNAARDAPNNKAVAEAITRDLARSWNLHDLKPYFVSTAADQINFADAQFSFNKLRPLGALKRVEQAQQTGFKIEKNSGHESTKTATIVMVAEFDNGRATVTMQLKSDGGAMKLWHLNVTPIGVIGAVGQRA
jgi:hypothetical protein